jgi:hypothetical protein
LLPGKRLNNGIAGLVYWRLGMEYGATMNAIDPVVAPSGRMCVCHDPENDRSYPISFTGSSLFATAPTDSFRQLAS